MVACCLLRRGIEERNLLSKGLSGLFLLGVGGGNISVWFQGNHDPVWVERDRATENTLPQKPHDDDDDEEYTKICGITNFLMIKLSVRPLNFEAQFTWNA